MPIPISRRGCLARAAAAAIGGVTPLAAFARSPAAVPLQLAGVWGDHAQGLDPRDFLASEKYDGVRALWDGAVLRTRSGRTIVAPRTFTAGWPEDAALDGELWIARGRFDALSAVVRRHDAGAAAWAPVRYLVFDAPALAAPFAERARRIEALAAARRGGSIAAVAQHPLEGAADLARRLDDVVARGGEGVMLHRRDARVVAGRSEALFKLKPWRDDEARVVGHVAGRGRHAGRIGALEVEAADGRRFRVGSGLADAERAAPPPVGSTVSYRFQGLTPGGQPRFPVYWRRREAD